MTRTSEVVAGAVIVAGITVAVLGSLWMSGVDWRNDMTPVRAVFQAVGALTEGADVRFRGVIVGDVATIDVEPGGEAVQVEMNLRRDIVLPPDAGVLLSPVSMFGEWQAEFVARSEYPRYDWPISDDPQVIPGYTLPDISRLTATADEIAQNLTAISDRVELAFTDSTAQSIANTIRNLEQVTAGLSSFVGEQTISFSELAQELVGATSEIRTAASAATTTLERIDGAFGDERVEGLASDASETFSNLRVVSEDLLNLRSALVQIDSTAARMDRISGRLDRGEGTLGQLLADTVLYVQLRSTLGNLDALLLDFRANPGRYFRLSIF
jgi:phospholipid/cholesterol/gamma-HCH transport system substrate-binding protein